MSDAASPVVLFEGMWSIEDGVWWIGDIPDDIGDTPSPVQANGLLSVEAPDALMVMAPQMYGQFDARVERHETAPTLEEWPEDIVEVSCIVGTEGVWFTGFEDRSDPFDLPAGSYRVRYSVSELDTASAQDEWEEDSEDASTYVGKHLFQFWPAPAAADAVIRVGSEYAKAMHASAESS